MKPVAFAIIPLLLGAFPAASQADYLKFVPLIDSVSTYPSVISRSGVTAYASSPDYNFVDVVGTNVKNRHINDRQMIAEGVNDSGDVVGIKFNSGTDNLTNFAFYAQNGHPSQLLLSGDDVVNVAINNEGVIAVVQTSKVTFYKGTVLQGTVSAGANQSFSAGGFSQTILKDNGELITQLTDLGTPSFASVSLSGGFQLISGAILPAATQLVREESDGKLFGFLNGKALHTDLSNAPVLSRTKDLLNSDDSGDLVLAKDGNTNPLYPQSIRTSIFVQHEKKQLPLSCLFPAQSRINIYGVNGASEAGDIIATYTHPNSYVTSLALLEKTGGSLTDYCPTQTVKIVGSCSKYFKTTGTELDGSGIPDKMTCQAEVTLKDPATKKPLIGRKVATSPYLGGLTIIRGKTDNNGKMHINFKVSNYTQLTVIAPYGDKKFVTQPVLISAD